MRRFGPRCLFAGIVGCIAFIMATQVHADTLSTTDTYQLNVGSHANFTYTLTLNGYNGNQPFSGGAGAFTGSTLVDTTAGPNFGNVYGVSPMFCVDLTHDINLSSTYTPTTVNTQGVITDASPSLAQMTGSALTNAAGIDWLMDHVEPTLNFGAGQTATDLAEIMGLQLAIWKLEYGMNLASWSVSGDASTSSSNSATNPNTYEGMYVTQGLAHDSGPLSSDVYWINPTTAGTFNQAQIWRNPTQTTLPGSLSMACVCLGVFVAGRAAMRLRAAKSFA